MLHAKVLITESLAPAVAISGMGLLIMGLSNRMSTVSTRVRDLSRELRSLHAAAHGSRIQNIHQQIALFLQRAYLIRKALFLMFGAVGMMVFTAVALGVSQVSNAYWDPVISWLFLTGLILMLLAVVCEGYETILNLRTLVLETEHSVQQPQD